MDKAGYRQRPLPGVVRRIMTLSDGKASIQRQLG